MLNVKQIANEDIYSTPTAPCACLDWIRFTFHYMCMTCCHISIWSICFLRPLMLKGLNVHWFQFQLWNSLLHYNMWYGYLGSDFPGSRLRAWLAATNGEDMSDGRSWASGNLLNKTRTYLIFVTKFTCYTCGEKAVMWKNYFPDWERNWHLMLWYLAGKWKVVGGPFVAWACGSKRSHGMRVPPPPSSYSTDLASEEHTRPYQTSVWQPSCCGFCWERSRSLKPATVGLAPRNRSDVSGHRPDHMDQKICRGRVWSRGQYWSWQYSL